jgi:hypothetical protein
MQFVCDITNSLTNQNGLGLILPGSFYHGKLNSDFYSPQKLAFFLIIFQAEFSILQVFNVLRRFKCYFMLMILNISIIFNKVRKSYNLSQPKKELRKNLAFAGYC